MLYTLGQTLGAGFCFLSLSVLGMHLHAHTHTHILKTKEPAAAPLARPLC